MESSRSLFLPAASILMPCLRRCERCRGFGVYRGRCGGGGRRRRASRKAGVGEAVTVESRGKKRNAGDGVPRHRHPHFASLRAELERTRQNKNSDTDQRSENHAHSSLRCFFVPMLTGRDVVGRRALVN